MEQPNNNMMGLTFTLPGPNMNNRSSMQRPQSGNPNQQIHAVILDRLRKNTGPVPAGWQSTYDFAQRASQVMQLVSLLRLMEPNIEKCVNHADSFEIQKFKQSPTKEIYLQAMQLKLEEVTRKRSERAQMLQQMEFGMPMNNINDNSMGMPQGNSNSMQNMGMNMNMGMGMNLNMPNGGMGMSNGQMAGQQNHSFPAQLQRPMQASPLPPQQQPQQQQQLQQSNTMDPSALRNPQISNQMLNVNQGNPQQSASQVGQAQAQAQLGEPTQQEIMNTAKTMYTQMTQEQRQAIAARIMNNMSEQQKMHFAGRGAELLLNWLQRQARAQLMKGGARQMGQATQQNGGVQMNNNMGMPGNNMPQTSQPGAPNYNLSSFLGQQANAIKSQESGEQVVPASNNSDNNPNNVGFNGQMNVQQGVNPQMLANQNGLAGNNTHLQMQFIAMQQDNQRREQLAAKQNQLAQQQAMAHQQQIQNQNQLRGQPGGLNAPNALNGGQVNSPGMNMSMLNRPIVPPGQAAPSTPGQQNRPQVMPPTPVNAASQIFQHHQTMLNQNNQQVNQGNQNLAMMNNLTPEWQERLKQMAPNQINEMLLKLNNQQLNAGTVPQNMNSGGPLNQQSTMPGMPVNMGAAVPGFNVQPPPSQQTSQQQPQSDQLLQQRLFQQQADQQLRQRAMDMRPFPKQVLNHLSMAVPDQITSWGALKQHIHQNQSVLPQESLRELHLVQRRYFLENAEEMNFAFNQLKQQIQSGRRGPLGQLLQQQPQQQAQQQHQQAPISRPPSSVGTVNAGQAPPAQMVPPTVPMLHPQNQSMGGPIMNQQVAGAPPVQPPTQQEMQMFRQNIPGGQKMTDEQIRSIIVRKKADMNPAVQLQAATRNAQMLAHAQARNAQAANLQQASQQQQQARPQQSQQAQNHQVNSGTQAQKRPQPSTADVMEVPNPSAAPQAPTMHMPPAQQQAFRMPTMEQLANLPPDQKAAALRNIQLMRQRSSLLNAQRGSQGNQNASATQPQAQVGQQQQPPVAFNSPPTQEETAKMKAIHEEVRRATPKGPAVQLDSNGLEQAQASLKTLWRAMQNIDKTWYIALRTPDIPEQRIKDMVRMKIMVLQNAQDASGTTREYLSVRPEELRKLEVVVNRWFMEMKGRANAARGQAQSTLNGVQAQQPRIQPAKPQQVPPMPVQPERKPSQTGTARKASTSTKAPPAPTENKKFDWTTPSPHAVPKYEHARPELTADKLKFPAQKKRKTADSQESTPAGQTTSTPSAASPAATGVKAQTPEQAKKLQASVQEKPAEAPKPKFRCDNVLCVASIEGFETEQLLKEHKEVEHRPIDDPMRHLLENAAALLGVDKDSGEPLPMQQEENAPAQARTRPASITKPGVKKEGQTPNVKQEGATPATPASVGKAGAKTGTNVTGKKHDSSAEVPEKQKTLMEIISEKIGFEMPGKDVQNTVVLDRSIDAANDSWIDVFTLGEDIGNDWSRLGDVAKWDWGLPEPESSPELTPSQSSRSSHESDISMTDRIIMNLQWDAFGDGDTGVPVSLVKQTQTLGLSDGEDTTMLDADRENEDGQKLGDIWDWSADLVDWDAFTGNSTQLFDAARAF